VFGSLPLLNTSLCLPIPTETFYLIGYKNSSVFYLCNSDSNAELFVVHGSWNKHRASALAARGGGIVHNDDKLVTIDKELFLGTPLVSSRRTKN
jgi:hypothetical protein